MLSRIQIGAVVCIAMVVSVPAARADGQTARIIEESVVSQPLPFSSGGKTVIVPRTRIIIDDGKSQSRHRLVDQVEVKGRASVIDGDTLRIQGRIIHLYGIDAFEAEQTCRLEGIKYPCGVMATAHLVELTLGRNLVCEGVKKNRLGELSAECRTGKQSLNSSMVSAGWALADIKETERYGSAEKRAKTLEVGIWRGEFVRPWIRQIKH